MWIKRTSRAGGPRRRGHFGTILLLLAILLAGCQAAPRPAAEPPAGASGARAEVAAPAPPSQPPAVTESPAPASPPPAAPTNAPTPEPTSNVGATGEAPGPPPRGPHADPTVPPSPTPTPAGPRVRTIALDPGHGGVEGGAANAAFGIREADLNLDIARRAADLLRDAGYQVVLTRELNESADPTYAGGGYAGGLSRDLQARIDTANAAGADLFFSVHNNGAGNPDASGTEVWYNSQREFGDRNRALAEITLDAMVEAIRGAGYPTVRRGVHEDSSFRIFRGQPYNIYVLGPGTNPNRSHEPTRMPGVLVETLFLSNWADAQALARPAIRQAIAGGYRTAVERYLEKFLD